MSLLRAARSVARPAMAALPQARIAVNVPVRSVGTAPAPKLEDLSGRQGQEFEWELAGVGGFNDLPAEGPFGTLAAPVRIYSAFHSRIVGCKGGDDSKHRLSWFELKAGKKHVCIECGQVFQLVTPQQGGAAQAAH